MGPTLACVLLLLSSCLSYGHSQEADLTQDPNWSRVFTGETVTLTCEVRAGQESDWSYILYRDGGEVARHSELNTFEVQAVPGLSEYQCEGVNNTDSMHRKRSNKVTMDASAQPKTTLNADRARVWTSNSVTLTCAVADSRRGDKWKMYWYRDNVSSEPVAQTLSTHTLQPSSVSESGLYWCRGGRGSPPYYTQNSNSVTVTVIEAPVSDLNKHPEWPEMFTGETLTLKCTIQEGSVSDWKYSWLKNDRFIKTDREEHQYVLSPSVRFPSGQYKCRGRRKQDQQVSRFSDPITVSFKDKPKATLQADPQTIPAGGSVSLSCSVEGSPGWKYYWYQNNTHSLILHDGVRYSTGPIRVSEDGVYWCRGGRGDPVYYTEYSDALTMDTYVPGPWDPSSPYVVGLIVGPLVVILLTILLLLLRRYRTSKDPGYVIPLQSQGTNQGSAADQQTNQSGAPDDTYCALQHGNTSVYGIINQPDDDYENDPAYVVPLQSDGTNQGSAADLKANQSGAPDDNTAHCSTATPASTV